jgi:hypothetical protein
MKKTILTLTCLCLKVYSFTQPAIARVEYYFDIDPGFGKATNITVASSTNVPNHQEAISIAPLAEGIHTLHIRSQSLAGKWSVTNTAIFLKGSTQTNIARAEYFFDTDPGFGNAKAILPIAAATDVSANVQLDIQPLSEGLHTLLIRSAGANGKWSVTNSSHFLKTDMPGNIIAAEYFIDTDPGFGSATPVAINPADSLANFALPVNITGLAAGKHLLLLRSKNALGKWSVTNSTEFTVGAAGDAPYINVNSSTDRQMCAYESFSLAFDAHGSFNSDNIFTAQLSDANGSFGTPFVIGALASTKSAIIKATLPSHVLDGNNYKIRVVSNNTIVTGTPSDTLFQLRDRPELGPDTLAAIVCLGETINLTPLYNTAGLTANWNTPNTITAPVGNYQLIATNGSGCRDTAVATVKQKIAIWTGSVSSDWHNPANWANGRVPDNKAHVIINVSSPNKCVISTTDGTSASVQVKAGGIFNLLNNKKIIILANCSPLPIQ